MYKILVFIISDFMVNAEKQLFLIRFIFTEDAIKEEGTYNNKSL